jgi:phosphatidylglycerol:prolipoprotein diacylglycerol transferase
MRKSRRMFAAINFPDFDPIFLDLGFFAIRWYGMAYLTGIILAWLYILRLNRPKYWSGTSPLTREDIEDLIVWAIVGIVVGGRMGYVLFYQPDTFLANPLEIFAVWHGGMSFHGGMLGVCVAVIAFAHFKDKPLWTIADQFGCAAPIGLFLGRCANFINGELYGRETDVEWGMIFPGALPNGAPRHPSQLYEAALEGILLFIILRILFTMTNLRHKPGFLAGVFIAGYGVARFTVEFFREPDAYLGLLWFDLSMGQLLSIPMILIGLIFMIRAQRTA